MRTKSLKIHLSIVLTLFLLLFGQNVAAQQAKTEVLFQDTILSIKMTNVPDAEIISSKLTMTDGNLYALVIVKDDKPFVYCNGKAGCAMLVSGENIGSSTEGATESEIELEDWMLKPIDCKNGMLPSGEKCPEDEIELTDWMTNLEAWN